jgi:hypothetical protein
VLFALAANQALAPSSKLAASRWVSEDVLIDGLPATTDDACYRAMDWLLQIKDPLEKEIFGQVANLLNLEVDLLFFDTTCGYFELDDEDEPVPRDFRDRRCPATVCAARSGRGTRPILLLWGCGIPRRAAAPGGG